MSRANNKGWDFIKVGETYQYKEDSFIAMVKILEDNSNDEYYKFRLQVESSNIEPPQNGEFEVSHYKNSDGYYSGMIQFYITPEYFFTEKYKRNEN